MLYLCTIVKWSNKSCFFSFQWKIELKIRKLIEKYYQHKILTRYLSSQEETTDINILIQNGGPKSKVYVFPLWQIIATQHLFSYKKLWKPFLSTFRIWKQNWKILFMALSKKLWLLENSIKIFNFCAKNDDASKIMRALSRDMSRGQKWLPAGLRRS